MLFSDAVEEPVKNPQSAPVENPVQGLARGTVDCGVGWVKQYQKLEIGKKPICGEIILPKNV